MNVQKAAEEHPPCSFTEQMIWEILSVLIAKAAVVIVKYHLEEENATKLITMAIDCINIKTWIKVRL